MSFLSDIKDKVVNEIKGGANQVTQGINLPKVKTEVSVGQNVFIVVGILLVGLFLIFKKK